MSEHNDPRRAFAAHAETLELVTYLAKQPSARDALPVVAPRLRALISEYSPEMVGMALLGHAANLAGFAAAALGQPVEQVLAQFEEMANWVRLELDAEADDGDR